MSDGSTIRTWWGDFTWAELKKFLMLAGIFGFTIGVYWALRPLKDSIFNTYLDVEMIPQAKLLSLAFVLPLALFYSWLVDVFPRHRLFYALGAIYATLALTFAFLFSHPLYGMGNIATELVDGVAIPAGHALPLGRMVGWAWYIFVESFGSIMVPLFWAFAADTTSPSSAKRGYAIVAFGAQLGAILGPLIGTQVIPRVGQPPVVAGAAVGILLMALLIWVFMRVTPKDQLTSFEGDATAQPAKKKTGLLEGIRLMLTQPYLLGIFAIISIYEIIITIFDFVFKVFAKRACATPDEFGLYLSWFGVYTNVLALTCVLLGVNNIGRKLGLRTALLVLPVVVIGMILAFKVWPQLNVVFAIMLLAKALNYALNQPTKEQLYIPTSKDAKYKAKAFIEMYGSRGSKGIGSVINDYGRQLGSVGAGAFLLFTTVMSLGLVGVWMFAAVYLGNKHKNAVDNNELVC